MSAPYYSDESVTLYHGDCREVTEWLEADVLITDPPYGIDGHLSAGSRGKAKASGHVRTSAKPEWDRTLEVRDAALNLWGGGCVHMRFSARQRESTAHCRAASSRSSGTRG